MLTEYLTLFWFALFIIEYKLEFYFRKKSIVNQVKIGCESITKI